MQRGDELTKKKLYRRRFTTQSLVSFACVVFVSTIIIYPVTCLMLNSFKAISADGSITYTFSNYLRIFASSFMIEALRNTLIIAVCTSIFAGIIGTILAWIAARTNCPWKNILEPLNLVPFFCHPLSVPLHGRYLRHPRLGLLTVH